MHNSQRIFQVIISTTAILILIAQFSWAQTDEGEFGDAPEGALAYPSTGVLGSFPTCVGIGPAAFVYHYPSPFQFFGPMKDFELDGNAGLCPIFAPYDMDECFMGGDAGLLVPGSYTIVAGAVVPCPASGGGTLGPICSLGTWGPTVDIHVVNSFNGPAFVNVLMDWNQDGIWAPSIQGGCAAPEHILIDFPIPPGFAGPLSVLAPPVFMVGGNSGYVWSRFTVSNYPVGMPNWDGSGMFEDGETEDYLLLVDSVVADEDRSWGSLKSYYRDGTR